jgi:transcriptional regulator with XRE-family HTH domain
MAKRPDTDVRKLFGRRLAETRKKLGWSEVQLSLASGVARSYLIGVERGQRNIALVNICRLASTMGVQPYRLLDLDGELAESVKSPLTV